MTESLFEAFRLSMMSKPNGSRKEAHDDFLAKMKADPAYLDMLATDYFERMAAVWTVREKPLGNAFMRTDVSQDKIERMSQPRMASMPAEMVRRNKEEAAARTAAAFAEMKAKVRGVVLLDLVLPNGKALRDATGADCAKAGGFFAEVAKTIKPTQVVDRHLSEADLLNIRARFYQANKQAAA